MEPRDGHINWGDWFFDYSVIDTEGLSLLNGFFKGHSIFRKLSLPVIRVKYVRDQDFWHNPLFDNGCGPYNDRISWDPEDFGENLNPISGPHFLVKISDCGKRLICIRESTIDNTLWLELGVYAIIGAYHIYQAWYINNKGIIKPRVFSKGLSCNLDHWHHPYWRFDFDLDGPDHQDVRRFDDFQFSGVIGTEGKLLNNSNSHYKISNVMTPVEVSATIIPPLLDDTLGIVGSDQFSSLDGYVRKFRPEEDRHWPHAPSEDISFAIHENCEDANIVFWSVCHLLHHASEGKDHFHSVGPTISLTIETPPIKFPFEQRLVTVRGKINITDFKLTKRNLTDSYDFDDKTTLIPGAPNGQVFIHRGPTGDVQADTNIYDEVK